MVVRFPASPQVSLKCGDQSKDSGAGHKKNPLALIGAFGCAGGMLQYFGLDRARKATFLNFPLWTCSELNVHESVFLNFPLSRVAKI